MADELGSSSIAKLLAGEVQASVERKTASLREVIDELKEQLNEAIDLLTEKEADCNHRAEMAEMAEVRANQVIAETSEKG